MISKPTVLVLGAGASADYGYPTGRALLFTVCERMIGGDPAMDGYLDKLAIPRELPAKFATLLKHSMQESVDTFLENRPEFIPVGKLAIALALVPLEREHIIQERAPGQQWYEYLFHQLGPSKEDIEQSHLTVVTFNYDRSLEYFLYDALASSFSLDASETFALYGKVPIIHMYGHLGAPHFASISGRRYAPSVDPDSIAQAVSSLGVAAPGQFDETPFELAAKAIAKAETVCFLGFAYHPSNVRRLGIPPTASPRIIGSALHLPTNEAERAKRLFPSGISLGHQDHDCLGFLQNNPVFE